jgi:hypothetical protein
MPEPQPPPRERIGGTIAGQKFAVETQHLISVLLIVVVAGVIYFLVHVQQQHTEALIRQLRDEHELMFQRMTNLANALRVVDWNQGRPLADRVPLDLPSAMFEDRRPSDDERRPRAPSRRPNDVAAPP